jgi:hypothetical protein
VWPYHNILSQTSYAGCRDNFEPAILHIFYAFGKTVNGLRRLDPLIWLDLMKETDKKEYVRRHGAAGKTGS